MSVLHYYVRCEICHWIYECEIYHTESVLNVRIWI